MVTITSVGGSGEPAYPEAMSSSPRPAAPGQDAIFDAVLTPYRSLPPKAFFLLMSGVALLGFCMGLGFFLIGAWPVIGFMGFEFFLLYLAFRINYRRARNFESLVLTRDNLELQRVDHRGREQRWNFQPYWLQVQLLPANSPDPDLALTSHGRRLVIGSFLAPEERISLAAALNKALAQVRSNA